MRSKIRWAKNPAYECGHTWTTGTGPDDPADTGVHQCIKDTGHTGDPTNDDHQCCCGNTSD